ncbi:Rv2578c family radical SAM protein [Nocardia sp. alder85J]|uniref:Rv2578c family radical SAM protein n=1 Tax=Nocardia sp. alder85J TaxID=2862949 RepID=UPI001CD48FC4|nr:Rv2578c family radical SAM protein [Nocardia sp. alder85J]MCX4091173.1 Rv2578c family radical SAM protein [Nocardia sp. alder85J]
MRWQRQSPSADEGALPGLERAGLVRSVRTPEFEGVTFHEVLCKSALNKVPPSSGLPFTWTINTMRGCSHACTYCFARGTHEYLDLDAGRDFDSQIVVKTNVGAVLRRELARRSWQREPVALGTNTDPYQRAEGRYRLMPGIITALAESGTPFSILTKGTLLRRDLPLLRAAAAQVPVQVAVSIAILDPALHGSLESGTPSPRARLELVRALAEAGFAVNVMAAPIVPYLTDGTAHLDELFGAIAEAGAASAVAFPMHLRGSTRGWFLAWLSSHHPALLRRYRQLYGRGAYVTPEYSAWLRDRLDPLLDQHALRPTRPVESGARPAPVAHGELQLSLFAV